ncbi:MAG: hypothetical protein U5L06_12685 [Rhodovibrio sp.]|nr:hypothetical protein [Rhodovibrio sp.]
MPYLQEVRATFSPKAGSAFEHVALGALSALAGLALALAGIGLLLGLGAASDTATGAVLLGLGALAGFASAMLVGFAANLEILHDIRARQSGHPPRSMSDS